MYIPPRDNRDINTQLPKQAPKEEKKEITSTDSAQQGVLQGEPSQKESQVQRTASKSEILEGQKLETREIPHGPQGVRKFLSDAREFLSTTSKQIQQAGRWVGERLFIIDEKTSLDPQIKDLKQEIKGLNKEFHEKLALCTHLATAITKEKNPQTIESLTTSLNSMMVKKNNLEKAIEVKQSKLQILLRDQQDKRLVMTEKKRDALYDTLMKAPRLIAERLSIRNIETEYDGDIKKLNAQIEGLQSQRKSPQDMIDNFDILITKNKKVLENDKERLTQEENKEQPFHQTKDVFQQEKSEAINVFKHYVRKGSEEIQAIEEKKAGFVKLVESIDEKINALKSQLDPLLAKQSDVRAEHKDIRYVAGKVAEKLNNFAIYAGLSQNEKALELDKKIENKTKEIADLQTEFSTLKLELTTLETEKFRLTKQNADTQEVNGKLESVHISIANNAFYNERANNQLDELKSQKLELPATWKSDRATLWERVTSALSFRVANVYEEAVVNRKTEKIIHYETEFKEIGEKLGSLGALAKEINEGNASEEKTIVYSKGEFQIVDRSSVSKADLKETKSKIKGQLHDYMKLARKLNIDLNKEQDVLEKRNISQFLNRLVRSTVIDEDFSQKFNFNFASYNAVQDYSDYIDFINDQNIKNTLQTLMNLSSNEIKEKRWALVENAAEVGTFNQLWGLNGETNFLLNDSQVYLNMAQEAFHDRKSLIKDLLKKEIESHENQINNDLQITYNEIVQDGAVDLSKINNKNSEVKAELKNNTEKFIEVLLDTLNKNDPLSVELLQFKQFLESKTELDKFSDRYNKVLNEIKELPTKSDEFTTREKDFNDSDNKARQIAGFVGKADRIIKNKDKFENALNGKPPLTLEEQQILFQKWIKVGGQNFSGAAVASYKVFLKVAEKNNISEEDKIKVENAYLAVASMPSLSNIKTMMEAIDGALNK